MSDQTPNNPFNNQPGQPGQPPQPGQPAPFNSNDLPTVNDAKGFFASLFDFTFKHYVTRSAVGVIYLIAVIAIGLFVTLTFFFGLIGIPSSRGASLIPALLAPIGGLLYLILIRIGLEVAVSTVNTAQNTEGLRTKK